MPAWPTLDWPAWSETADHLHLMTQIVGKVRFALTPWLNHSWHVPLYVTARGLGTSPISAGGRVLEIEFDLLADRLELWTSDGGRRSIPLAPGSIADFNAATLSALRALGIDAAIDGRPSEIPDATPFAEDRAPRPYDRDAVSRFHQALIRVDHALKDFRTGYLGKASPIHFFWGSFDLASSRFSGRVAPRHPGGIPALPDAVTCEAYSHEEWSAGFWPGSAAYPRAAFYAYAYPAPPGFADAAIEPAAARYHAALGEFLLDYDDVRVADDPAATLMAFLRSTYAAAADLGDWDRDALECPIGVPRQPRKV